MKIFLSHSKKDDDLARQLVQRLTRAGFTVWDSDEEIAPGDNWAKKIGTALDDSDLMVILLTPGALRSDEVRQNIEFALASKQFAHRVLSVFVGPAYQVPRDVPWILLRLPHLQLNSPRGFPRVIRQIRKLFDDSPVSRNYA